MILIILVVLILVCGFGGYRAGPGFGYYGGGLSLILFVLLICIVLKLIPGLR